MSFPPQSYYNSFEPTSIPGRAEAQRRGRNRIPQRSESKRTSERYLYFLMGGTGSTRIDPGLTRIAPGLTRIAPVLTRIAPNLPNSSMHAGAMQVKTPAQKLTMQRLAR